MTSHSLIGVQKSPDTPLVLPGMATNSSRKPLYTGVLDLHPNPDPLKEPVSNFYVHIHNVLHCFPLLTCIEVSDVVRCLSEDSISLRNAPYAFQCCVQLSTCWNMKRHSKCFVLWMNCTLDIAKSSICGKGKAGAEFCTDSANIQLFLTQLAYEFCIHTLRFFFLQERKMVVQWKKL